MTKSQFQSDCPLRRRAAGTRFRVGPLLPAAWVALALAASLMACSASTHATHPGALGVPASEDALARMIEVPGPIRFERIVAADWAVDLGGLLDLDHPKARTAGLESGPEAIEIYFYLLEHPTAGDFIVDSGVAQAFREDGRHPDVSVLVEAAMNTESLEIHQSTAEWLATRERPLSGVFLTHIHLDHVMGLPDVPASTPVYVGPGETGGGAFLNLFTRGTIDRMLEREGALFEWPRAERGEAPGEGMRGVIDVFGDGSLFALHVPGHTPGSMAFLVRTTEGPKLLVGDTSHTEWGWTNDVTPGTFTADRESNALSLAWLRALADRSRAIEVHLGHQRLRDTR